MSDSIIEKYSKILDENKNLEPQSLRKKYFSSFSQSGFPKKNWEEYRYTPLQSFSKEYQFNIRTSNPPKYSTNSDEITIECVNGFFNLDAVKQLLESLGITALTASEALEQNIFELSFDRIQNLDPFKSLNAAFFLNGLYLSVSKLCRLEKPITVRHIVTEKTTMLHPLILLNVEDGAQIKFHEIYDSVSQDSFVNSSVYVKAGNRSHVQMLKITHVEESVSSVGSTEVSVGSKAFFEWLNLTTGSCLVRENMNVHINGDHSEVYLKALSILKNKNVSDHNVQIFHHEEESKSRQYFKSILKDNAHYIFKGKINIDEKAQKTDSDQLNKNLVLSLKARVDTKPQLSVFADDVRATHGAAIGQLDTDEKFYLMSRGLSPEAVNQMLCAGYASDILSEVTNKFAKKECENLIDRELKGISEDLW